MAAETSSEITKKYEELRNIGNELAALTGRDPKFGKRQAKRESENEETDQVRNTKASRRITMDSNEGRDAKKPRLLYDIPARRNTDEKSDYSPIKEPTVQSTIREPKSRDETIAERKKNQKAEDGKRNQRMFGNLMGTLKQFQKETQRKVPELKQAEKLKEVEERLERTRQEEREKYLSDKKTVEVKMKEKQMEIKKLKQRRAIQAKGETKIAHYRRLQNYIQTETKPRICFLPAQHTIRSMELLKNSARNMEVLIKEREDDMHGELKQLDDVNGDSDDGIPAIKSAVKEEDHISGLSSLVVKVEPKTKESEVSVKEEIGVSKVEPPDSES
ncbi:hypothetical protein FO519_004679 [Halicephalobus sp. NKZ332]|nr:hypothetical protein FO519_004679 [Halicephalobus sp. NKZ332]